MTDGDERGQKQAEDESSRAIENAVMLAFFAVLVDMVAQHDGRCTKGAGLRGPGASQLWNDRCSGAINQK
ncbi:hypothetical protein JQ609_13330 [Bradyrhizobium sp. AUGA SZCCT0169]|uniref:hypothetical protein n=1 Tax=Bradyrhizobium sp. AUGA SZCCT0169 TaxID=2807663 RepID=UPI001BA4C88B|nr:hypothetical protein [Bradyrhizobium sp. AUGA SZCCT0169]MBR1247918.1 hypothetical protein [Bradyrhizobium sp. AUGA SZCCT0169]